MEKNTRTFPELAGILAYPGSPITNGRENMKPKEKRHLLIESLARKIQRSEYLWMLKT
jgi:hypothetical protein